MALAWRDDETELVAFVVTGLLFMVGSRLPRRQPLAIFTPAWVVGRLGRGRREVLLALVAVAVAVAEQQSATQRDLATAERDRATLAHVEERLRIARELHDVLAHSISVICVQATVGEGLAATDPASARRSLRTIGDVSRAFMDELRQMLTLLRHESGAAVDERAPYEPAHGLADLEPLADTSRSAGLPVLTGSTGTPRALPAAADLCAYRIIQEALTNTLKHAGPSHAVVGLDYRADTRPGGDAGAHHPARRRPRGRAARLRRVPVRATIPYGRVVAA